MGRAFTLGAATFRSNRDAAPIPAEQPFTGVVVHTDPAAALEDWAELERVAPASIYQTRRWLLPWIETIGRARGLAPMLVVARDHEGRPVALLPLAVQRLGPLRTAVFLGGKDANINLGLFRPGLRWTMANVAALLRRAAHSNSGQVDVYALVNQPHRWAGVDNPLALLPHRASPSFVSFGDLESDAEAELSRRFSSDARKKLRKKARRLESHFGPIRHVVARDAAMARVILAAFHMQKTVRMRAQGLPDLFGEPAAKAFLDRATTDGVAADEPGIELHALFAGSTIAATFGGAGHGSRFSGMFNSFDSDIEIARSSPGDLLLMDIVAAKCGAGFTSFDLGIGEANYKDTYCDRAEPLFDAVVPVTLAGHCLGTAAALRQRLKRRIKQTPWLWSAVGVTRRLRSRA